MCTVAAVPGAAGVRVWQITSGSRRLPAGRSSPEGASVAYARYARQIKTLGAPVLDTIGRTSYEATNMMLDAGFPQGALAYWKSTFLAELNDTAIDTLISAFADCPSPMSGLIVEHFHGAAARVGIGDTAFPHRREAFNLLINSEWLDPADSARNIAWARRTYDAMRPHSAGTSYVNYMSHDERENPAEVAYGPNLPRLRALKSRYDPSNLFHLNHNIRPSP